MGSKVKGVFHVDLQSNPGGLCMRFFIVEVVRFGPMGWYFGKKRNFALSWVEITIYVNNEIGLGIMKLGEYVIEWCSLVW